MMANLLLIILFILAVGAVDLAIENIAHVVPGEVVFVLLGVVLLFFMMSKVVAKQKRLNTLRRNRRWRKCREDHL